MVDGNYKRNFDNSSDIINFEKLEHETLKILYLGLLVGVSFHAALGAYFIYKQSAVKVIKPLTTELIIRKPRMTKPFEFKKKRIPQRIMLNIRHVQQKAIPSGEIKIKGLPSLLIGNVSSFEFLKDASFEGVLDKQYFYIPEKINIDLSILKKPDKIISLKEEMVNMEDLDTGKYKGMVIQDPKNKQNIKGFIYIAVLWGTQLEPAYKRAVVHLCDAMNRFTKIQAKPDKHLQIDSRELLDTPFVFITSDKQFEVTDIEAKNLGNYLRNGGFAVLDNGQPEKNFGPAEMSLRWMIKAALGSDATFLPIPREHPIYHCFYDFDDGPPIGAELETDISFDGPYGNNPKAQNQKQVFFLEGIWIKNRLVAVYSDKGYCKLMDADDENEPQLKMGVNLVVFALIQEGGLAQKFMEQFTTGK